MFGRLLPKETSFFDFFEQHAALTVDGTKEFVSMVASGANIDAKARRIKEIEHETDVITHRCVEALHRTFITPIERDDIHRLITRMDDVMDFVEAASERIALYELKEMTEEVRDLADVLARAATELYETCKLLRNLKHQPVTLVLGFQRIENGGKLALELHVNDGADDLGDASGIVRSHNLSCLETVIALPRPK